LRSVTPSASEQLRPRRLKAVDGRRDSEHKGEGGDDGRHRPVDSSNGATEGVPEEQRRGQPSPVFPGVGQGDFKKATDEHERPGHQPSGRDQHCVLTEAKARRIRLWRGYAAPSRAASAG
jgi:hypothetical protein